MKKLMSVLLGLALVTGTATITLAQDKKDDTTKKEKKKKSDKKKKDKTDKTDKSTH